MATDSAIVTALETRINVRLKLWNKLWVAFLAAYFILGTASVGLSALAATDVLDDNPRKVCSVIAAVCVALLGFLRPEVRCRNLVRAWRELDVEKSRFIQSQLPGGIDPAAERLLQALGRTERIASDDEHDSSKSTEDQAQGTIGQGPQGSSSQTGASTAAQNAQATTS